MAKCGTLGKGVSVEREEELKSEVESMDDGVVDQR